MCDRIYGGGTFLTHFIREQSQKGPSWIGLKWLLIYAARFLRFFESKVCWKWKNADIIYYKVISQLITGKCQKVQNIYESSWYWKRNFSYLLNNMRNFNDIFRKDVTHDNIKSHKNPGFYPLFRRYNFKKTTGGSQIDAPLPCRFRVKQKIQTKIKGWRNNTSVYSHVPNCRECCAAK